MEPFVFDPQKPHLGGNIDGGDPFTYCPKTWDWLLANYQPTTVLDVGCAQGQALDYFANKGCRVLGVEGLEANVRKCKQPVMLYDIQSPPILLGPHDLVWCCEVSEHIEERFVDSLLSLLTVGKVIAMTHAVPGQDGHHHVNCQDQEYWISALETRGYTYREGLTKIARKQDPHNNHFGWHGLLFERTSCLS